MPARYRAAPPDGMVRVPLDSFTAIYHRASGITHLVAEPAPQILAALADGPLDEDELIAVLGARYELGDFDRAALAARLDELAAAGLVTSA